MTTYHRCLVKTCKNNTRRTPAKIFVPVPMIPDQREVWFRLAHRDMSHFSSTSRHHFCEDHFDLPNEMANFYNYKKNRGQPVKMIKGCLPRFLLPVEEKEPEQFKLQRTSNMKTYHKKNDNSISQENVHECKKKDKVESRSIPISITQEPENVELKNRKEDLKIENLFNKEPVEYNLSLQKTETKHKSYTKRETNTKNDKNKCVIVASNSDKEILSDQDKNTNLNKPLACKKTRKNKSPHETPRKTNDSMDAKSITDILENAQSNIEASSKTRKRKRKIDDCQDTGNLNKNSSASKVNKNIKTYASVKTKRKTIDINNKAKVSVSKSNLKALETTSDIKLLTKNNHSTNITKTSKLLTDDPYYLHWLRGTINRNRENNIENDRNYLCDNINPLQYDDDHLHHVKALAKVYGETNSNDNSCDFNSISKKRSYDDSYEPNATSEHKSKSKESCGLAYISRVTKKSDKGLTDTENNSADEEMERFKPSKCQFLKESPDVVIQVLVENLSRNYDEHNVTAAIKEDADDLASNDLNIKVETKLNDQVLDEDLRRNDDEHNVTVAIKEEDVDVLASNIIDIKVEVTETEVARKPSKEKKDTAIEDILRTMIPPVFHTCNWHTDGESVEQSFEKTFSANSKNIVFGDIRPIDIFLKIWDEEIMAKIVKLINTHATLQMSENRRYRRLTDVNELYVLFASVLSPAQFFKDTMTSHRFKDLMCLKIFSDNIKLIQNEIQPVVKHLNQNFQTLYNAQCELCVDKMVIDNDSVIGGKTTAYTICDALSSYILSIAIDNANICDSNSVDVLKEIEKPQDMCTKSTHLLPGEIILNLMSPFLHKGHTFVMDSNFSCPLLARYLKFNQTDFFGSLDEVPENLNNRELKVGEILSATSGDLTFMLWNKADKPVKLLSTYHNFNDGSVKDETPQEVRDYERVWSAIIEKNMLLSRFPNKSLENIDYDKLLIWLLNVSVVNTYIIYKQTHKYVRRVTPWYCEKFWFRLAEELVEYTKIDVKKCVVDLRLRPIVLGNHYIIKNDTSEKHLCEYCKIFKKRLRTNWKCDVCNVPLCMDCMKPYHTNDKLIRRNPSSSKAYMEFVDELGKRKEQHQQHVFKLFT